MRLQTVPPARGVRWVIDGLRLFMRQPLALSVLFLISMLTVGLLGAMPVVGAALAMAAAPVMNLAFVLAGEALLEGGKVTPLLLAQPFRGPAARVRRLLWLCALHGGLSLALLALADLVNPEFDEHLKAMMAPGEGPVQAAVMQGVQFGALLRMAFLLPLVAVAWYAPIILHRSDDSVAKALFASALITWRNAGAFLLYGAGWGLVNVALGALAVGVVLLLGQPALLMTVAFPLSMMFCAAVLVSQVFTVRDCLDLRPAP